MKLILASLLALTVLFEPAACVRVSGKYSSRWGSYVSAQRLSFHDASSELKAFATYSQNMEYINNWNSNSQNTYKLKENQFTHLTNAEMRSTILMPSRPVPVRTSSGVKQAAAPKVSLTLKPLVNYTEYFGPARNQGNCGSCYTFAAAGVVEAQFAITYGGELNLSEEQLLDCTFDDSVYSHNQGCDGGDSFYTFAYIRENGICGESAYPYESFGITENSGNGYTGPCRTDIIESCNPIKIKNYGLVTMGDETVLAGFIQLYGPVTIYIDASPDSLRFYSSGIFHDPVCSNTVTNHAVIAVGFGSFGPGQDYWIVRNSWGDWGMNGYILIARNKNNTCGVASSPFYAHFT